MPEVTRTSYDEIEYISRPFPQAHPDSMAALANLYGLNPPDPATVLDEEQFPAIPAPTGKHTTGIRYRPFAPARIWKRLDEYL